MYISTLVEFILVDVVTLLSKEEVIRNGNHSSLYTNATIDMRRHEITLRCHKQQQVSIAL